MVILESTYDFSSASQSQNNSATQSAQLMFRPDDKIGPYTLVRQLGRGAFGVVWLAEKRTAITTTDFALKIALDQEPNLESIRREADLWKQAGGHPNVLPIIEADIYDDYVVIVSEYAPDGSLEEGLKRQGAFTIERSGEIVSGILTGLHHLHTRGIIHRDLKPANILFQGETPRLADFGIARILKTTSYSETIAGTPAYMAPEAFDGKRTIQTDIWSAGVILYRLVGGRLPYPQADMMALMAAIMSRDPEPLRGDVPLSIEHVVAHALARDPSQRYQSAAEMRQALVLASQSIDAGRTVGKSPRTDLRTTIRAPVVIALGDDGDESTIVRQPLPRSPDSNQSEDARSHSMPAGEPWINNESPRASTGGTAYHDPSLSYRSNQYAKRSTGRPLAAVLVGLLVLSAASVFFLAKRFTSHSSLDPLRPIAGGGGGLSSSAQPSDASAIKAAVTATLDGWTEATKSRNVDACMSFFADKLDTYYSTKNVSSEKVRTDFSKAFSNYSTVDMQLSNVAITPDASDISASATFDKSFNFQGEKYYKGTVQQKVWLANVGGKWLITGLKELKVYGTNSGEYGKDAASNAAAPAQTNSSAPSPVLVRVYNVDDQATVFVNGIQVLKVPYRGSDEVDVSKALRPGMNEIRLRVQNFEGCYTYGFEIRQNDETIFSDKCGQVGHPSVGCNNNDYTLGVTYDKTILVRWQSGIVVAHSVVSPASSRAAQIAPRPEGKRDELSPTGLPNGVPGSPSTGPGAGNGGGVGPGKPFDMRGARDVPATSVDSRPVPLNSPQPRYTQEAERNKIQGNVSVRVLVGSDGLVKRVMVVRGLPHGLDERAIQAAYQLRFTPAMKNGQPVAYWMPVVIEFNLR